MPYPLDVREFVTDAALYQIMLSVAIEEARLGLAEGGIPIGAALFTKDGKLLSRTLAPCWYCSGLVRQFRIGTLVVGESRTFAGGLDWLREHGVEVIDLDNRECRELLEGYIAVHPEVWNEDIGEEGE